MKYVGIGWCIVVTIISSHSYKLVAARLNSSQNSLPLKIKQYIITTYTLYWGPHQSCNQLWFSRSSSNVSKQGEYLLITEITQKNDTGYMMLLNVTYTEFIEIHDLVNICNSRFVYGMHQNMDTRNWLISKTAPNTYNIDIQFLDEELLAQLSQCT